MFWRISLGLGLADPMDPPAAPALATVVRRCGGLSRSWGARLACLTRRGSPLMSPPFPSGSAAPRSGADPSEPGSRGSSQGGPAAGLGRGEATGVIGVAGPAGVPGPGAGRPPAAPGVLGRFQPGNGAGWSGYGTGPGPGYDGEPPPGKGAEPAPGNGAEPVPGKGAVPAPEAGPAPGAGPPPEAG